MSAFFMFLISMTLGAIFFISVIVWVVLDLNHHWEWWPKSFILRMRIRHLLHGSPHRNHRWLWCPWCNI